MSRPTILYGAHKALERLEWLDKHVRAHPAEVSERLADAIEDIEKFLLRVIHAQEH
jgi:hypothetical protein